MDQLHSLLLQEYDIVPRSLQNIRSVIKVMTDRGSFAVKKCRNQAEHLHFIYYTLQFLKQAGFRGALPFLRTKHGTPFVEQEDGIVYVVPWIEGRTGKQLLENGHEQTAIFQQLGKMHRISIGRYKEQQDTLQQEGERLQQSWNQRIHKLNEYREFVNKRVYPSPVDVVFMANVDELIEMAVEATGRLEEWLNTSDEEHEIRLTFCHGRLGLEHMVRSDQLYFVNFDAANLDFPARDLSYLIRHLSSRIGDRVNVDDWLTIYTNENPLTKEEIEILSISLQYPTMVLQFLDRYYTKQYAGRWTELTLVRRFEKLIDEQQLLLHV